MIQTASEQPGLKEQVWETIGTVGRLVMSKAGEIVEAAAGVAQQAINTEDILPNTVSFALSSGVGGIMEYYFAERDWQYRNAVRVANIAAPAILGAGALLNNHPLVGFAFLGYSAGALAVNVGTEG